MEHHRDHSNPKGHLGDEGTYRILSIVALAALAFVAIAQAHVTVHPNALPAGGFTVINIQVPNERDKASTVKVDVQFPNGIFIASPRSMPGWKARVITKKLPKPVEIEPGFSVSSRVDRVVFSGGRIGPGQFLSFPVSIKAPAAKAGTLLTFKALQTYSNGEVVRWIGNPSADEPAPQVLIRPATSPVLDYPAGASAAKQGMGKTLKGFVFGLPLGVLGTYLVASPPQEGRVRRALLGVALAALVVCSAAAAHGGGGALGFRSTVTRITPAAAGLTVTVLDYDDRLQVRNETGKPLVILGYEGEPYLAFRDGRVYRNTRSPATYLNDDRYGQVALPDQADAKAPPEWEEVSPREDYDWHDHRIHWMSQTLPPKVRAAKDKPHHVFDWTVPARFDGKPLAIAGTLDYRPPGSKAPKTLILVVILSVILALGGIAIWLRHRREGRTT